MTDASGHPGGVRKARAGDRRITGGKAQPRAILLPIDASPLVIDLPCLRQDCDLPWAMLDVLSLAASVVLHRTQGGEGPDLARV